MSGSTVKSSEYAFLFHEISSCHNPRFIVKKWIRDGKRKRDIFKKERQEDVGYKRQRLNYHISSDSIGSALSYRSRKKHIITMENDSTVKTYSIKPFNFSFSFGDNIKPAFSNSAPAKLTTKIQNSDIHSFSCESILGKDS